MTYKTSRAGIIPGRLLFCPFSRILRPAGYLPGRAYIVYFRAVFTRYTAAGIIPRGFYFAPIVLRVYFAQNRAINAPAINNTAALKLIFAPFLRVLRAYIIILSPYPYARPHAYTPGITRRPARKNAQK